jgi:hypothetical protein
MLNGFIGKFQIWRGRTHKYATPSTAAGLDRKDGATNAGNLSQAGWSRVCLMALYGRIAFECPTQACGESQIRTTDPAETEAG